MLQMTDHLLSRSAKRMGMHLDGHGLQIPFFDQTWIVTPQSISNSLGQAPTEAVGLVLSRYVIQYPATGIPPGPKVTFRELTGAGPLVYSFAANTNKLIASTFAADLQTLKKRSLQMHGRLDPEPTGHDLSLCFPALPRVPLYLQFNADDDQFSAHSTLFFNQSAEHYLDMQTLFLLATYLAGRLVTRR
jgi:hypothetical protein